VRLVAWRGVTKNIARILYGLVLNVVLQDLVPTFIVRSVSGHVSPVRSLKPAPLRSRRITSVQRYYRRLRLPFATAPVLAV
jgi:hypothetical protein